MHFSPYAVVVIGGVDPEGELGVLMAKGDDQVQGLKHRRAVEQRIIVQLAKDAHIGQPLLIGACWEGRSC